LTIERLEFASHMRDFRWAQGDHVVIAGPTGSGKTTLAKSLLEKRGHVLGFAIKAQDDTIRKEFSDWSFVQKMSDIEPWMNRVMLWPRPKRKEGADAWRMRQRLAFKEAFDIMLTARGWCVYIDELKYMSDPKFGKVGDVIEMEHYIARSAKKTLLSAAQRPSFVPLAVLSNASHAYVAKTTLAEDIKRLGNLGGIDRHAMGEAIRTLESEHDFVYIPALRQGNPGIINTRR
jgi:energy-coupling factor transporter ATP-binding protein EcfA2